MKKIIVVCGPTATGKSDYAVELAQEINGEIVSADSRQVYKGLDIGSGKITKEEMHGIPHHLLDVADPKEPFSVVQYKELADAVIKDINTRGKTPIIVGGTGFYIDAIICDTVFPAVTPNHALRAELHDKPIDELLAQLHDLDERRYNLIDKHNRVRIVRAIEIALALGAVPELERSAPTYDIEWRYLDLPDDELKNNIHNRLIKRLEQEMINEVATLHEKGLSWEKLESFGLEYKYVALYLQEKFLKEEMLDQLERAIWQYVKRQRTWFKKYAQ
jgi:tRNA dimethylallyltransferase